MSSSEELGVGKEILSYCGKCKLALAHVVVSMDDKGEISKCECKTCGANHKYRDPEGVKKRKTSTRTKKETISNEEVWKQAVADAEGEAKAYAMNQSLTVGDLIDHPKFGKGVVEKLVDNNKAQILFEHNIKTLICESKV